jgi:Secretion system C-terminal sorting domain
VASKLKHIEMKKTSTLLLGLLFCATAFTQSNGQHNGAPENSEVIYPDNFSITRPLRELAAEENLKKRIREIKREHGKESKDRTKRTPQTFLYTAEKDGPEYGNDQSIFQTRPGQNDTKAPIENFAGADISGFRPMDPSGAVGTTYYMQCVNATTYRIYDKVTNTMVLSGTLGVLWTPDSPNDGDPIVMYDRFADRWFVAQFGISGNRVYIGVSQTNDPTGAWYTWTYTSANFPDYLKFGIWQDGYYMTSNQSPRRVYAFERTAMLAGSPTAKSVTNTYTALTGGGFFLAMPADADGNGGLPPGGTACPIFQYTDNAWGGGAIDGIRIHTCTVNWTTPTMTISGGTNIATAAFDASYSPSWDDIDQPSTTQFLDGIGGVLQYRVQYRQGTTYNTAVMAWPVRISASQRSFMWAELRQNAGVWSVFQQGTYVPDTKYRWMPSISMDDYGSIAVCYARCSNTAGDYMGLYYTGRLSTDPAGTFGFAEQLAIAGVGSQTGGVNRCGDYAQTTLDPDGYTFWHTGEYMGDATGSNAADTRIYSFQLSTPGPIASCAIVGSDADNLICAGTSVTFTATPTNGGSAPTYQWYVNGSPVGTGGTTYTTSTLTNGQVVTCQMTSNLPGVVGSPCTSNSITMTVSSPPTTANAGADFNVCGLSTNMIGNTATTGTGTWAQVSGPGVTTFGLPSSPLTLTTVTVAGTYVYSWTISNAPCTPSTDNITITFTANPTTANAGPDQSSCLTTATLAGNTITVGSGAWSFISGPATPTITTPTSPTSTVTGLTTTGTYVLRWTATNGTCTNSNDVNLVKTGTVAPAVSIAVTTGSNPSCTGSSVTFTATPTTGGASPTYQWFVNGSPAGTGSTFTTTTLVTGDAVTCTLTSSDVCASPTTATSSAITMTVNPVPSTPTITASADGITLTSSSATGNQWYLNGTIIPGATGQTYTATTNGNYTVVVTTSGCSSASSSIQAVTTVSVIDLNDPFGINIFPNPNNGIFTIEFNTQRNETFTLKLSNAIGQVVYTETVPGTGARLTKVITIKDLQTGAYNLVISTGNDEVIKKVIIR